MKRFISFSGGVESTTMCILYGKGATAIWSDTGAEHELMYLRIDAVEKQLQQLHKGDFKLIRLKGDYPAYGKRLYSLEETIKTVKYMPSGQARYCTKYFKIFPIDDYLATQGDCELMIGFNADEEGRTGNLELKANVRYTYPLIDDGLTRSDCEDVLHLHGLHPNFPAYMLRGGCRMCFFKSKKEYKALYYMNKPEFEQMIALEEGMQDQKRKYYAIMGNGQSLRSLAQECEQEIRFDMQQLYEDYKREEKSCGAFCHR